VRPGPTQTRFGAAHPMQSTFPRRDFSGPSRRSPGLVYGAARKNDVVDDCPNWLFLRSAAQARGLLERRQLLQARGARNFHIHEPHADPRRLSPGSRASLATSSFHAIFHFLQPRRRGWSEATCGEQLPRMSPRLVLVGSGASMLASQAQPARGLIPPTLTGEVLRSFSYNRGDP